MINIPHTESERFERFIKEYEKLCAIYGMGITANGVGICAVINGYCDGYQVFEINDGIRQLRRNHRPEHLEPILLETEYIPEDK